ncbi:hypothetical protein [Jeotgalibacillus malaysiensis]|uniref:hypothetical protein n=1 Tax=Jeotgalibacillus malaysiensis TaxID=1508404 RepID=UPI003850F5A6
MSGFTPKTNWQYDEVVTEQDFNRIEQGIADALNNFTTHLLEDNPHDVNSEQLNQLSNNYALNSDPPSNYPQGLSVFKLSSTTAGFPHAYGTVLTERVGNYTTQTFTGSTNKKHFRFSSSDTSWTAGWADSETTTGAQGKVDAHANRKDNPHEVSKSQVGLSNVDNVQQASKTEFNTHNTDSARHITSAERAAWNAKETPSGAQEKVDAHADLRNNPHNVTTQQVNHMGSYTRDSSDPAGDYPLGISVLSVGPGASYGNWPSYGTVTTYRSYSSNGGTYQTYTPYSDVYGNGQYMVRYWQYQGTDWDEWEVFETTDGAQSKVDAHANLKNNPHAVTKAQVGLGSVDNVQQATKTEFNSHVGDSVKHITSAERTSWNGKASAQSVADLDSELTTHQAEKASAAELGHVLGNTTTEGKLLADSVPITDAGNLFSATDVEGAMSELFTNVSDGKDLVGGAITDVDPNVVIPADPTFKQLATGVGQINTGKKWASGEINEITTDRMYTINGLDFSPSKVIITASGIWSGSGTFFMELISSENDLYTGYQVLGKTLYWSSSGIQSSDTNTTVTNDGFVAYVRIISGNIKWYAYE